jgi:hypothetical protein
MSSSRAKGLICCSHTPRSVFCVLHCTVSVFTVVTYSVGATWNVHRCAHKSPQIQHILRHSLHFIISQPIFPEHTLILKSFLLCGFQLNLFTHNSFTQCATHTEHYPRVMFWPSECWKWSLTSRQSLQRKKFRPPPPNSVLSLSLFAFY